MSIFRLYTDAGADGYPPEWHKCPTCAGSGWICAATDEGVSMACKLCRGSCPSSDGCPSCTPLGGCGGEGSIKALVRAMAEDRCVRCGHPYQKGSGEWSPCDIQCTHSGKVRWRSPGTSLWKPCSLTLPAGKVLGMGAAEMEACWRILTVHHLIEKRDCRWFALVALCQRCHLQIQGKVMMDRAFIFEHSDWFKPYAAGWYAWKYEGREITRAEAEERMDELLAYERLA